MKKRTKVKLLAVVVLAALLCLFFLKRQSNQPSETSFKSKSTSNAKITNETVSPASQGSANPEPVHSSSQAIQAEAEQKKQEMQRTAQLWRTPILYYGKVVDESNQPISGVQVSFNTSSVDESLTKEHYDSGTVTTDERGIFKIDGVRGVGMVFQLSHPNYYLYPGNIMDYDIRDYPQKGALPNTEENALVFRMHSKGHPVSLVHRADGVNVPLDGTPTKLDMRGSDYNQKIGQLVIEASGNPPLRYNQQPFDWDAKITVPDGGLIEYTNQFDFVAPDSGYQSSVEFAFPKETVGWADTVSKNYFVKLPSGYARLNIYIGAKRPLFFSVEYDYNPDGSPNLERAR